MNCSQLALAINTHCLVSWHLIPDTPCSRIETINGDVASRHQRIYLTTGFLSNVCWHVEFRCRYMGCTCLMKIAKDTRAHTSSVDLSAWECRRPTPRSLFLQRLRHSTSDSPLHRWQPSIFGCRP